MSLSYRTESSSRQSRRTSSLSSPLGVCSSRGRINAHNTALGLTLQLLAPFIGTRKLYEEDKGSPQALYLPDEVEGDVVEQVTELHQVRQLKGFLPDIELTVIKDTGTQDKGGGKRGSSCEISQCPFSLNPSSQVRPKHQFNKWPLHPTDTYVRTVRDCYMYVRMYVRM